MAYWMHTIWQRHNLRPEEFYNMPRPLQLFYIASEITEGEHPCRLDGISMFGKK